MKMRLSNYKNIKELNCNFSARQLEVTLFPNKNFFLLKDLLDRKLLNSDNGSEVGSVNYISNSPKYFIKAKALQSDSFIPTWGPETKTPIRPQVFTNQNLSEGDIILSKDSNIGETIILDKDYKNHMLSGALYKLPISRNKYYILAFLKHNNFKDQLGLLVPKGSTIRHAKRLFLKCKIPFPNTKRNETIRYIEHLTMSIIIKEKRIKDNQNKINFFIENGIENCQNKDKFIYKKLSYIELGKLKRLDTGIYNENFKRIDFLIKNYNNGFIFIDNKKIKSGNTPVKRYLGKNASKYLWLTPTNISEYGTLTTEEKINCYRNNLNKDALLLINRTSKGGIGKYVGISMFYDFEYMAKAQHNQGIYRVIDYPKIDLLFMTCFMNCSLMRDYCSGLCIGSKMKEIKANQFLTIPFPKFPIEKKKEIVELYYNEIEYPKINSIDDFKEKDISWNDKVGIIQLDRSIKQTKQILNDAIDKIIIDEEVEINLNFNR